MAIAFYKCILIQCLIVSIRKLFSVSPSSFTYNRRIWFLFCKTWHILSKTLLWFSFNCNVICDKSILPKSDFLSRRQLLSDYNSIYCHRIYLYLLFSDHLRASRLIQQLKNWLYFFELFVIFHLRQSRQILKDIRVSLVCTFDFTQISPRLYKRNNIK